MFEGGSSLGVNWLLFVLAFECGVGGMICKRRCISGVAEQNGSVALSVGEAVWWGVLDVFQCMVEICG